MKEGMFSVANLYHRCVGKNLMVRFLQSTQRMWWPPLTILAALFALMQFPLFSHAVGKKKLEVFSWWTSGGEAAALNALFNVYNKQYPGVEIVNAVVAGGGGSAARSVLHTRLIGGNPPDTCNEISSGNLLYRHTDGVL
jgi:ABC-type glycerol-3-phosphate transport system substrate-binding protein